MLLILLSDSGIWQSSARACLQTLEPEKNRPDHDHCQIVDSALLVTAGDPAKLFQSVDQALHPIPQAIGFAIKEGIARLALFTGDHRLNATPTQVAAHRTTGISLVARQAARP